MTGMMLRTHSSLTSFITNLILFPILNTFNWAMPSFNEEKTYQALNRN